MDAEKWPPMKWHAVDPQPEQGGNSTAPPGQVWVCNMCGKTSNDRYGEHKISHGWDESCMIHAVLCYDAPNPKD